MTTVQLSGTRTGSTFFYRCLDSHPDIDAHPEIFRISPERVDYRFLDNTFGDTTTFKLMYNHIRHFKLFESLKKMKIMHIVRTPYKKVLSDVVSNIINSGQAQIYYDPQTFLKHVRGYEDLVKMHKQLRQYTEYMEFNPESFIQPDSTMTPQDAECVCCFLNVKNVPLKSDSKKLTPDKPHWDYFTNADEIMRQLNV